MRNLIIWVMARIEPDSTKQDKFACEKAANFRYFIGVKTSGFYGAHERRK
jgi:hypothetical protein